MQTWKYLRLVITFLFIIIFRTASDAQDIAALRDVSDPGERARIRALSMVPVLRANLNGLER